MTTEPKPLNRFEVWASERAAKIFVVVAALMILCAGAFFWTYQKQSDTADAVNVLRPQVTKINQAVCDTRSLESEAKALRCAERIRVGLVNCRRYAPCRAALLAAIAGSSSTTAIEPEGGGAQSPSTAGQQPGPGDPGHHGGSDNHHGDQGQDEEPSPSPSPAPSPAPGTEPSPVVETPGKAPEAAPASGVDVELCALERTCVDVEVGLDPKGLLP